MSLRKNDKLSQVEKIELKKTDKLNDVDILSDTTWWSIWYISDE